MSRVSIRRCQSYEYAKIERALREIITTSDFPIVDGKRVLIKPNILSDSKKELGITTHPLVVEVLIAILKELGASKIFLGDSPGLHLPSFNGSQSGYKELCERTESTWVNFANNPRKHIIDNKIRVNMAAILDEVDVIISVAKFKTHELMYLTGSVKNMFGTLPGLNKSQSHVKYPSRESFSSFICKIFKESKTSYGIIDGIIGMEGPGPANGTLRQVGLLLGSSNCFELDDAMRIIMGYKKSDIPLLNVAIKQGYTKIDPTYPLLDPNNLILHDYRRIDVEKKKNLLQALLLPFLTRFFDKRLAQKRNEPHFNENKCIRCKRCIEICPAKALVLKDNRVVISEKKCIRCYCCNEMCPVNAIDINSK